MATETTTANQRPKPRKVWVGFVDGKPHIYHDDAAGVMGARYTAQAANAAQSSCLMTSRVIAMSSRLSRPRLTK